MCAANVESFTSWSTTLTNNQPTSTDTADLVSDLTKIQAEVRKYVATKGADIASAATTDLAGATGNYVHITGTTTVEGFGTVAIGVRFLLVFDGILTLTYSATKLILPTAADIVTAAGDRCEVVSLGSGNFRCLWYQRANGAPLDAELAAIAGLTSAANTVPKFTGSGTAELLTVGTSSGNLPLVGTKSATEALPGLVELATTTEAAAGTDTARAVTAAGVEAHMVANALGWGQSWTDVTGSRALATTYTNDSGRPIIVSVYCANTSGGTMTITVGEVAVATLGLGAVALAPTLSAVVPNGEEYSVTNTVAAINAWLELR